MSRTQLVWLLMSCSTSTNMSAHDASCVHNHLTQHDYASHALFAGPFLQCLLRTARLTVTRVMYMQGYDKLGKSGGDETPIQICHVTKTGQVFSDSSGHQCMAALQVYCADRYW